MHARSNTFDPKTLFMATYMWIVGCGGFMVGILASIVYDTNIFEIGAFEHGQYRSLILAVSVALGMFCAARGIDKLCQPQLHEDPDADLRADMNRQIANYHARHAA